MKINLHSRWQVTLAAPLVAPSKSDAKARRKELLKQAAKVKLEAAGIRNMLNEAQARLARLEDSIRAINESDAILAATFGTSNAVVNTRSLRGFVAEPGPDSHFRNQMISFITKTKGLQPKGFPSNAEVKIVRNAYDKMLLDTMFKQMDQAAWTKAVAKQRGEISKLQQELYETEQGGMADTVRHANNANKGQDPLSRFRDTQSQVTRKANEIQDLVHTGTEILKELSRVETLKELQEQGVNKADLERDVKQIKHELSLVEIAKAQADAATAALDKATKGYRQKHEAALAKKLRETEIDYDSEPDIEDRLQEVRDNFDAVWQARMEKLGLQGVTDRSAESADLHKKSSDLRTALGVVLHRIASLGIRLGNKTVKQYQNDLELRVVELDTTIKVKQAEVHPAQQELENLKQGDAWRQAVEAVIAGPAGAKFPSISRNAIEALHDLRGGLLGTVEDPVLRNANGQPLRVPTFPDAERDIRALFVELFDIAEKKMLKIKDFRADTAIAELLASNNVEAEPGAVTTRDTCIEFLKTVIRFINNSTECEARIKRILGSHKLMHTPVKARGVVLDTTSPAAISRRAVLLMRGLTDPSTNITAKLKPILGVTTNRYREQVAVWVHRNVRVEDQ